ncbi:MAG: signal peptidase I [Thiolinea sp.]
MQASSPRQPVIAALMSLILPGFGQLYNGQLNKGILLFIAFALISIPLPALLALYMPSVLMLPLLLLSVVAVLGLWLYGIVQAWRYAKTRPDYQLRDWQQPALYIGFFLLAALLVLPVMTHYIRGQLVESFRIPSTSMEPSVLKGDFLFADKRYNCPNCKQHIRRGDVAIFVYPNNRTRYYIKRIIGLPGDRIRISAQTVFVNDKALTQETLQTVTDQTLVTEQGDGTVYQVQWSGAGAGPEAAFVVPQGNVFVLGDNRDSSQDSREFGYVPMMDVVGKVRQVWLSLGEQGVRWSRMGKVID